MKSLIVTLSSVGLLCACGMGNEAALSSTQTQQDELLAMTLGDGTRLGAGARSEVLLAQEATSVKLRPLAWGAQPGEFCTTQMILPTAQGTIQSVPRLGIFGVASVGNEVQSAYYRSNGVNEEFRRGIAEFNLPAGTVSSAVLKFREHRGWTSQPLPSDTHLIEAYPGNLEVEVDDFDTRSVVVGRFETDPNLEPMISAAYDLTKAVNEIGPRLGLRFRLESDTGSGTAFMDLGLDVTTCRSLTHYGN